MKYTNRVSFDSIKDKYMHVIAWGNGPLFRMNYRKNHFKIDFIIDGTAKHIGEVYKGIEIRDAESISDIQGKTLIVIYAIYENQIINQIKSYNCSYIDTIVYPLLSINLESGSVLEQMNAKSCEDFLTLMLIRQLELESVQFLEIGVCHPIIRNNTYLINEQLSQAGGEYKGVLVEANPLCWTLIEEYRSSDSLIRCGVGRLNGKADFYIFPNLLGHSTFVKEIADEKMKCGIDCDVVSIEVKNINTIIADNFDQVPDVLALDAEGMDFIILDTWNSEKYPFKIIITELIENNETTIYKLMLSKGYKVYAQTIENIIWVKKEYCLFV